jgi:hypothetical protein
MSVSVVAALLDPRWKVQVEAHGLIQPPRWTKSS